MPGLPILQEKILEALLFASGEGVTLSRLAEALGCDMAVTRQLLSHMAERYADERAGIQLSETQGSFRLCTHPAYSEQIRLLLQKPPRRPLTQPLLETLSIVAYKQPVTKGVIEDIRGVSADHAVNRLLDLGLITERGRLDAPGKPILFGTSEAFLRYYGLKDLDELFAAAGREADGQLTLEEADDETESADGYEVPGGYGTGGTEGPNRPEPV